MFLNRMGPGLVDMREYRIESQQEVELGVISIRVSSVGQHGDDHHYEFRMVQREWGTKQGCWYVKQLLLDDTAAQQR